MEQVVGAMDAQEKVIAAIRELASENLLPAHLKSAEINGGDTAETLGLDSIGAIDLIDRLESTIGVRLPDDFIGVEDSVATIAERLRQLQKEGS